MDFMKMIKGVKNPKVLVMDMLKNNNNPMIKNLAEMGEKGDTKGVENFARNFFKEKGRDFDKEFGEFMKNVK